MQSSILKNFFPVILTCLFCLLASGCVWYAPLPVKHQSVSARKTEDFEFLKRGRPLRSDVEAKLGAPDLFCSDLNVDVYAVQTNQRPKLQLLFFIIPVGFFYDYPGFETAYIKFDDSNRVERYGLETNYYWKFDTYSLRRGAEEWLTNNPAHPVMRFTEPDPLDFSNHDGYVSLFDGQSLKGWDGNPKFWRVEDGAIVGEATRQNPCGNTYLFYRVASGGVSPIVRNASCCCSTVSG